MNIFLADLLKALSSTLDLVDMRLRGHHFRVAYIADAISQEQGMNLEDRTHVMIAALLHDIGSATLKERVDILSFSYKMLDPHTHAHGNHAELGFRLLKQFRPFHTAAHMVRYHHLPWNHGQGLELDGLPVPFGSHILHLADRIDALIEQSTGILEQTGPIAHRIQEGAGGVFNPKLVEIFLDLSTKEGFWFDLVSHKIEDFLFCNSPLTREIYSLSEVQEIGNFFSQIIDFRCSFTASHSKGVSMTSTALASHTGMSQPECLLMQLSGYLHDIGKLAVPSEILYKAGTLDQSELFIMRKHSYLTLRVLQEIRGLEQCSQWAALHHEFLDGSGYPFHLSEKDLSIGSKIMTIADIFTALMEDRPYRKGLTFPEAKKILDRMSLENKIDGDLLHTLYEHHDEIDFLRQECQNNAREEYQRFYRTWSTDLQT